MPDPGSFPIYTPGMFALLGISWLAQDPHALPALLREKLAVPYPKLADALSSLTTQEHLELKQSILQAAAAGDLPGPMQAHELYEFLNSLADGTHDRE